MDTTLLEYIDNLEAKLGSGIVEEFLKYYNQSGCSSHSCKCSARTWLFNFDAKLKENKLKESFDYVFENTKDKEYENCPECGRTI